MNPGKLSLAEIVERSEHLLRLSPADATIVSWIETSSNLANESARSRRAEASASRVVVVRVREGRRTGLARSEASDVGELQATLRQALAVARGASISPDWEWPRGSEEPVPPAAAGGAPRRRDGGARPSGRRSSGCSSSPTSARRCAAPGRSAIWSWRRPGGRSGPPARPRSASRRAPAGDPARASRRRRAARSARSRSKQLIARAQGLQATEISEAVPEPGAPAVLAPEAAVALLELVAREVFSGRRFLAGQGPLADPSERRPLSAVVRLVDEPGEAMALGFPFDYDGVLKRRRELVHDGELGGPVLDLELAARCGRQSTGHGVAGEDAISGASAMAGGRRGRRPISCGARRAASASGRSRTCAACPARACRSAASRGASAGSAPTARSRPPCRR